MDYEKAYKEALERARDYYDFYKENPAKAQPFIDIFPELAESEDERIRKEIIELVKKYAPTEFNWRGGDEHIAWLEKQKESLHVPETCKENPDSFTRVPENAEMGTQEQKPAEFDTKAFQDGVKEGRRLEREEQGQTKEGVVRDKEFIKFSDGSFIDLRPDLGKMAFDVKDGEKVIVQIRKK